jgi:hypothetical protein
VAFRVVGADDGEALLLVEAGEGLAPEPPGVAALLQGGVVEQALTLQRLGEEAVLGGGRLSFCWYVRITRPE